MIGDRGFNLGRRRGLVILVVMVVVTLSALIGSSMLLVGENAGASAVQDRRSAQARLAAWSGAQAVMSRLHAQRDDLLDGGAPVLPESWTFPIEQGGAPPAFRVLTDGAGAVSENAKLDVNLASAEMLEALPMIDAALARAIVDARPFASVAELGSVPGVTPGLHYPQGAGSIDAIGDEQALSLADVLTVFSFDPNIQLGEGEDGEAHRGAQRVNLGLGWSDELRVAVERRWDESAAELVRTLFEQGERLASTSDVVALYRRYSIEPEGWVEGLDALTTIDSEHVRGLVDLNRASPEVLAAIPGIDEAKAGAIGDARQRLGLDQRRTIVWPVLEGILTQDEFQEACDWLTTRSMQWRVRVEGGTRRPGALSEGDTGGLGAGRALDDRVTLECVIDVSSRRPRVAYLRDVTGLELALSMSAEPELELEPDDAFVPGALDDAGLEATLDDSGLFPGPEPRVPPADTEETDAGAGSSGETRQDGRIGRWAVGSEGGLVKRSGTTILMDFDRDHLGAIGVQGRGASARVSGWGLIQRPERVKGSDPSALGAWLRERLDEVGLGGGRVVIGAPRSEVVLKLLSVPGGGSLEEHELANVVRLQMQRQTAVAIEDAVFDYVPFDVEDDATDRKVLVGAIPGEKLAWRRRVVESAGLKLGGLRLRASGIAELVGSSAAAGDAPALGVGIGPASVEFALVEHGRLVFARTADLPVGQGDDAALAQRIAVEARRTAMSFRVAQRTPDVGSVVVLGDDALAKKVAHRCAEDLGVPSSTLLPPIEGLRELPPEAARAMSPLVGLAIQDARGRAGLDFISPRKAPDAMGTPRRVALLAVLGAMLVGGGLFVARTMTLGSLNTTLESLSARSKTLQSEYLDALARDARAEHLESWIAASPEWSAELRHIVTMLPDPDEGPLDQLVCASEPTVRYAGGDQAAYPGTWAVRANERVAIDGRSVSRDVSTSLRERILADGRYGLQTRGADVADRFSIELRGEGERP